MSLFVLDTDMLTLLRQGHSAVVTHALAAPQNSVVTTIVSFEEQVSGWYTAIRQARDTERMAKAYDGLLQIAKTVDVIPILPFEAEAIARYLQLRKQFPRNGKLDLSIAAIAMHRNAVLVTRNRQDFEMIQVWPLMVGLVETMRLRSKCLGATSRVEVSQP